MCIWVQAVIDMDEGLFGFQSVSGKDCTLDDSAALQVHSATNCVHYRLIFSFYHEKWSESHPHCNLSVTKF